MLRISWLSQTRVDPLKEYHALVAQADAELRLPAGFTAAEKAADVVTHAAPASSAVADATTGAASVTRGINLHTSISRPQTATAKWSMFVGGGPQETDAAHKLITDAIAAHGPDAQVKLYNMPGSRRFNVKGPKPIVEQIIRQGLEDAKVAAAGSGVAH